MRHALEEPKKVCQNTFPLQGQNGIGFQEGKIPEIPMFPGCCAWVKSDKESSPVVGMFTRSGA